MENKRTMEKVVSDRAETRTTRVPRKMSEEVQRNKPIKRRENIEKNVIESKKRNSI